MQTPLEALVRLTLMMSAPRRRDDRGDVPGWVLITVMTAGIVTVLWQVAGPQLVQMLQNALNGVKGPGR
ncbi:hypothetical protein K8W59_15085 [Nocardioides rotundus]|uniref:hypothetical protein n=1 Tax=Nocardioides rotundus TaxID=1774216 RepID=UPI001CBD2E4C|nr:hypothetical protein [Nocardioides rotundus]UAL32143.1 hypothetical protein K8W59_15085 [Nocardioides rotundus]